MRRGKSVFFGFVMITFGAVVVGQRITHIGEIGPVPSAEIPSVVAQVEPVVCERSSILRRPSNGEGQVLLIQEEFVIIGCDYDVGLSLVAYRYGTGDFSIPALLDVKDGTKVILEAILKDGSESFRYEIVDNLSWMDEKRLIYSVYDSDFGESVVKLLDLETGAISDLFSVANPSIVDVHPEAQLVLFRTSRGGGSSFFIYDIRANRTRDVLGSEYYSGYILSQEILIGVTSEIDEPVELHLIKNGERIDEVSVQRPSLSVQEVAAYDRTTGLLIVETRTGPPPESSVYDVFEIAGLTASDSCQ